MSEEKKPGRAPRPPRQEMPAQDPVVRRRNFTEVALGFTPELAQAEASRCIQCKKPACVTGCPVNVKIPEFIKLIAEGDYAGAAAKLKEDNNLPAICGRVCPQETQCEEKCILAKRGEAVGIGRLERFAADMEIAGDPPALTAPALNRHKVAVIGAGPAGLTCAGDLARLGYDVTVFEALHEPGGVLIYGIPEFRLPKQIVKSEVDYVRRLGVKFDHNVVVARTVLVEDLFKMGYEAIFVGTGAGLPKFMNIPGENLLGVYSANEWLTRINLMKAYLFPDWDTPIKAGRRVVVVGSGIVAMDSVRCALRLGADEAHIVYRRSRAEMPARAEEVHHAEEEGVVFNFLTNPVRILGND
ncbi:MAG: FAD-dependent oxidoreductase, partial [Bacillota bacterium]|nr:FAD-dependent oxidoreductase [Bacillota bacterium]